MTDIYLLEYLSVLWRRKGLFLTVFLVVFLSSAFFALSWDNYKASATVEVAPPAISTDVVDITNQGNRTAQAMADLQISRLKHKVLSTNSLAEIITRLDLYPDKRKSIPIAYIAAEMKKNISLELLSTSLANPASAQKASALQLSAIAFTISFKYSDPYLAQQTVNELVSRFLDEDIQERKNVARKTSEFLKGQIDVLAQSLAEQEERIAEFRAAHGNVQPDALAFNQQASIATSARFHAIESEIVSNMGRIGALRAQLAQTDPYTRISENGEVLTTPYMQLKLLRSQYATLSARYGSEHPDVVRVIRQINALERELDPSSERAGLKAKTSNIEAQLIRLRDTYGESHPDIRSLKTQKSRLEGQLSSITADNINPEAVKKDADNPVYLQILAEIEAAEKKQEALTIQKEAIRKQQEQYISAITENPEAEKKMAALARDYDNSILLYKELKAKKLAADISQTIELGRIGQRLTMIDAPELPLGTSPPRKIFLAAGFILAVMSATCCVVLYQILSRRVMGPYHLESLVGVAPLVTIPRIWTLEEKLRFASSLTKIFYGSAIALIVFIAIFFTFVTPLDIFWVELMRRIGP
ncbi:MAG: GumC family protein [Alphaproteobacteria bacterium]